MRRLRCILCTIGLKEGVQFRCYFNMGGRVASWRYVPSPPPNFDFFIPSEQIAEVKQVDKIIDLLTSPSDPTAQAYHVVAPSLPGFTFSSAPKSPSFDLKNMASITNNLMHALGYPKYMAQGGDWGSMVVRIMGIHFPESCIAVHVNMVAASPPVWYKNPLSMLQFYAWAIWTGGDKNGILGRLMWWRNAESGMKPTSVLRPELQISILER